MGIASLAPRLCSTRSLDTFASPLIWAQLPAGAGQLAPCPPSRRRRSRSCAPAPPHSHPASSVAQCGWMTSAVMLKLGVAADASKLKHQDQASGRSRSCGPAPPHLHSAAVGCISVMMMQSVLLQLVRRLLQPVSGVLRLAAQRVRHALELGMWRDAA